MDRAGWVIGCRRHGGANRRRTPTPGHSLDAAALTQTAMRRSGPAAGAAVGPDPGVVAVSGPDNVGKSTQLRILARRLAPRAASAGALHEHDHRWAAINTAGMANWWFQAASPTDLADVLARSYLARHRALSTAVIGLVDRGVPMLEASLAATLSVREGLTDLDARGEALRLLEPYRDEPQACEAREIGIVLLSTPREPAFSTTAPPRQQAHHHR